MVLNMEVGGGYDHFGMTIEDEEVEEGYRTPTHEGSRIPVVAAECPPAPKRKRIYMQKQKQQKRSMPRKAKDGYFQHPDLDLLFKMMSTREPFVQIQSCFESRPDSACY